MKKAVVVGVIALGSNGLTLDREGRVVFCTHGDRAVKRLEKDGKVSILPTQERSTSRLVEISTACA